MAGTASAFFDVKRAVFSDMSILYQLSCLYNLERNYTAARAVPQAEAKLRTSGNFSRRRMQADII